MSRIGAFLCARKRLISQQREIKRLRADIAKLEAQNSSMRDGMRRCVSCEYRIDFKSRQGPPTAGDTSQHSDQSHN